MPRLCNQLITTRQLRNIGQQHYCGVCLSTLQWFLANRTNGRAIGTVCRLSVCRLQREVLWLNSAS